MSISYTSNQPKKVVDLSYKEAVDADKNEANVYRKLLPQFIKIIKDVDDLIENGEAKKIYKKRGQESKYLIFVKNWNISIKSALRKSYSILKKTKNGHEAREAVKNFEFYLRGRMKIFYNKNLELVVKKLGVYGKTTYVMDVELQIK